MKIWIELTLEEAKEKGIWDWLCDYRNYDDKIKQIYEASTGQAIQLSSLECEKLGVRTVFNKGDKLKWWYCPTCKDIVYTDAGFHVCKQE